MSLDAHEEVARLTRELQAEPGSLEGLATLPVDDLRRLRSMVGDALHDAHRPAFQRAAAASALLPTALTARLAQTLIGPYLAARIAAEMPDDRAVKLAGHLDVDFLADVCLALDPVRVADTVRGLPEDRVVEVAMRLLAREEHVTLGKFVEVVQPGVLDRVTGRIDDPATLLAIATSIEAHHRLDDLVSRIDDERVRAMIATAVAQDRIAPLIALVVHLGPDNRARVASLAAEAGPEVAEGVVHAAQSEDAWADVLPLLSAMDPAQVAQAVNVPATLDPAVLRAVVETASAHDLWDDVVPVLAHLDDERASALATMDDLLTPEVVAQVVAAVLPRQELWAPMARTLAQVPATTQRALADRLTAMGGVAVAEVMVLAEHVPEARDLPLVVALREREG